MSDNGATNQFWFPDLPNGRIILSEEVFTRLLGDLNLCAYSGNRETEYGTILYGKEIRPNVIYFDFPSKHEDYVPTRREFDINYNSAGQISEMYKEMMRNIEGGQYDCIAHFHTHPYIGGTSRFFSNKDLNLVKSLQEDFQPSTGNKISFLGGLLSVSPENLQQNDEISFVYYDENGHWYKITNVNVFLEQMEVPFNEAKSPNRPSKRDIARKKTVDLLLGDQNPNADFYSKLFIDYNYRDSEFTPMSPARMPNVNSNNRIVITEEAYNSLERIRSITEQTNKEVAYIILGEEKPDGSVLLDTVLTSYQPESSTSADFSSINKAVIEYFNTLERGGFSNSNKQVICHGHTHGKSPVSDNFSFGDLISYVEFNNMHPLLRNRQVESIGMLMPPCGDYNFIFYENNPQYEGFYTFPKVSLLHSNGIEENLPAYQKGNYLDSRNRRTFR